MPDSWPNLFIPGAGKSGTTTLHHCLSQHPDIWMSNDKEPIFFSDDHRYGSVKDTCHYLSLFNKGRNYRYRGESSTSYMIFPKVIPRIKKHSPNPKFIFILRNPIDRAFSHYTWLVGNGQESRSFKCAFEQSLNQSTKDASTPHYFGYGCYGKLLIPYYEAFKEESIHLVLTEELKEAPLSTINSCFEFLGLHSMDHLDVPVLNATIMLKNPVLYKKTMHWLSKEGRHWMKDMYQSVVSDAIRIKVRRWVVNTLEYVKRNSAKKPSPPSLDDGTRRWLRDLYHNDIKTLKELTGSTFPYWRDFSSK